MSTVGVYVEEEEEDNTSIHNSYYSRLGIRPTAIHRESIYTGVWGNKGGVMLGVYEKKNPKFKEKGVGDCGRRTDRESVHTGREEKKVGVMLFSFN